MTRMEELIKEKEQLELSLVELEQKSARTKSLLAALDRVIEQDKDVEEKPQEKIEYFLFGSGPCAVMGNDGFDAVVEYMSSDNFSDPYELYKFVPSETNAAGTLLESFDGYMDFRGITKEQYEILISL